MANEMVTSAGGIVAPAGSWAERYAKYAVAVSEKVEASAEGMGSWLGTKSGVLSFKGEPVAGNVLDVVIVDFVRENQFYTGKYNPDRSASPVCYAFGDKETEMEVHSASQSPQNPDGGQYACNTCPHNKFGSSDTGKGKACKNVVRLGLLPASPLTPEYLAKAEPAWLKVPVLSVKPLMNYISGINTKYKGCPPWGVVTRIGTVPDKKAQFLITFTEMARIPMDEAMFNTLEARYNQVFDMIQFPHKANDAPDPSMAVSDARMA